MECTKQTEFYGILLPTPQALYAPEALPHTQSPRTYSVLATLYYTHLRSVLRQQLVHLLHDKLTHDTLGTLLHILGSGLEGDNVHGCLLQRNTHQVCWCGLGLPTQLQCSAHFLRVL